MLGRSVNAVSGMGGEAVGWGAASSLTVACPRPSAVSGPGEQ